MLTLSVQHELDKIKAEYATLKPEDIKLIDPCMGSGHILVYAFDVFMQIYENAGWSQRDAAQSIIQNNIYGLDIDDRAAQLSYFAVLMKARQYDRRILTRGIEPNVYAVQESNGVNRDQLKYFGAGLVEKEKKTALLQMERLLNTLNDAKEYGSLLNVEDYDWVLLEKFVENTDTENQISFDTFGLDDTAEQLKQLIKIGKVMAQKYEIVATNPPYAGTSNLSAKVNNFVKENYPDSKADLFAVFIERCGEMLKKNGYQAMITMHSWMFLSSYEKLREKLQQLAIINMAHLGARAFEEIGGEVVQTTSFVLQKNHKINYMGKFCRLVEPVTQQGKEKMYLNGEKQYIVNQDSFTKIPGKPVAYWISKNMLKVFGNIYISDLAISNGQNITGNNNIYIRLFWEVELNKINSNYWAKCARGGGYRRYYGNDVNVILWTSEAKSHYRTDSIARIVPEYLQFKEGITWSYITSSIPSFRKLWNYELFEKAGTSIFIKDKNVLNPLLGLLNSVVAKEILNIINPTINFQVRDILAIPIKEEILSNHNISMLVDENISITKNDWDSFETSWDFKCHPLIPNIRGVWDIEEMKKDMDNLPQRLYIEACFDTWQEVCGNRFHQLKANEEELNRLFIDVYGLQNELTPEVENKDITVQKADLGRDIRGFISYVVGCMFGRYSLDSEGIVYAGGEWDERRYLTYIPDGDNCIPITDEEYFSDDIVTQFVEFVKTVYGADTLEENLDFIANALGTKGDTSREVIRNYFLKDFYTDHLKVYQKHPIYWLFDSGKQNGFKALIYMHRYDADTVGRVRTDYLHKAQKYVETAMQSAQYTIDNATSASEKSKATKAVTKYTKQLAEMKIYDEAIAHVANQRIEIDLDDGVKVNYAKFQGVEVAQEGKKALKVDLLAKI